MKGTEILFTLAKSSIYYVPEVNIYDLDKEGEIEVYILIDKKL